MNRVVMVSPFREDQDVRLSKFLAYDESEVRSSQVLGLRQFQRRLADPARNRLRPCVGPSVRISQRRRRLHVLQQMAYHFGCSPR